MTDELPMDLVYLPDSWVLEVLTSDRHVCFKIDAVLLEGHPLYYWPPKPGEQHPYARLRWCLVGVVSWHEGPTLHRPAVDASGEEDFGNIDTWSIEDGVEYLAGSWGAVSVRDARHYVEHLV